jgi:hypothetical protein
LVIEPFEEQLSSSIYPEKNGKRRKNKGKKQPKYINMLKIQVVYTNIILELTDYKYQYEQLSL